MIPHKLARRGLVREFRPSLNNSAAPAMTGAARSTDLQFGKLDVEAHIEHTHRVGKRTDGEVINTGSRVLRGRILRQPT